MPECNSIYSAPVAHGRRTNFRPYHLMPMMLASSAKFYYGMDFGSGESTTVEHKIIPSEAYLRGGCHSGYMQMRDYWRWALGQVSVAELVGGRSSSKSLYLKPSKRKSKAEDKKVEQDKLRWLWFEEMSEFENFEEAQGQIYQQY